jgi:(p)ppGpp synthase/HD superfamily hydrolase
MLDPFLDLVHRSLRYAAIAHRTQVRKGSDTPYISHPVAVAMILQRYGFDESVLAAAILHDVVEDTPVTLAEVEKEFGPHIAELVHWVSEPKRDESGQELPWAYRKQYKFEQLQKAPVKARAIALADKLHNLYSVLDDERAGRNVWSRFKASKSDWLANATRVVESCTGDDLRLQQMGELCRMILKELTSTRANPC